MLGNERLAIRKSGRAAVLSLPVVALSKWLQMKSVNTCQKGQVPTWLTQLMMLYKQHLTWMETEQGEHHGMNTKEYFASFICLPVTRDIYNVASISLMIVFN